MAQIQWSLSYLRIWIRLFSVLFSDLRWVFRFTASPPHTVYCSSHVSGAEAAGFVRGAESSQLLFTPNSISCSNQISSEVLKHAVQTETYRHGYVRQQQGYVLRSEGFLLLRVEKIITELKRLLSVPLCLAPSLQTADISVSELLWI